MYVLLPIFLSMLKIGCFAFGGGYAIIALLENEFITKRNWIDHDEFLDVVAIAESTPGPIGINMATYAGFNAGGVLGGILATLALVFPSIVVIIAISKALDKFRNNVFVHELCDSIT